MLSIDKRVDHTNRIVLVDPVVQAFSKQHQLSAIYPLNEGTEKLGFGSASRSRGQPFARPSVMHFLSGVETPVIPIWSL
jgi:hypothetical protein